MAKLSITQKEIGERLRERRKALDLTLADVAGRMGEKVADSTVQRTEVGTQNPTMETFLTHCAALDISPAVILDKIPITIRPTVQEALRVIQEHVEITGQIIKKFSKIEQEMADFSEKEMEQVREQVKAIKENRSQSDQKLRNHRG